MSAHDTSGNVGPATMIDLDAPFVELARGRGHGGAMMACLYTGRVMPPFCSPMQRRPSPPLGMSLDLSLAEHVAAAMRLNASIHDGALMIGRVGQTAPYRVCGWSYRLFPPEPGRPTTPNKGSAFNSCLAMSVLNEVDFVYLSSGGGLLRFQQGAATVLDG